MTFRLNSSDDFLLMFEDTKVAQFDKDGNLTDEIDSSLLPPFFKNISTNLLSWAATRSIDKSRVSGRFMLKALHAQNKTSSSISMLVNSRVITDRYWVKAINNNLQFCNVNLNESRMIDVITNHTVDLQMSNFTRAADLTSIGTYDKAWVNEGGTWWLSKIGTPNQIAAEIISYHVCLHFNIAVNTIRVVEKNMTQVKDFTDSGKKTLIHAHDYFGEESSAKAIYERLKIEFDGSIAEEYKLRTIVDAVLYSWDRHNFNWGFLKNSEDNSIALAPVFDNNLAIFTQSGSLPKNNTPDILIQEAAGLATEIPFRLRGSALEFKLAVRNAYAVLNTFGIVPSATCEEVTACILRRYEQLIDLIN